ncbi:Uncharacterised protein r2_g4339 [Pycnogonum litorale]
MLVSAFGSKKKKQAMSSRIKLKVSDKAIDSAVNKTISGAVLQMAETQRNNDTGLIKMRVFNPVGDDVCDLIPRNISSLHMLVSSVQCQGCDGYTVLVLK